MFKLEKGSTYVLGGSGVGIGNFEEIGPLDTYLKPRNSTWLKKADLMFVFFRHRSNYNT
ncbi:Serine carboxypeptidase-like 51 [Orobanche hederae]